ncbi:sigma-54-dependent Fis family transcriptional regulator [Thermanaerosceptrum fracticalcis]|uniref:Sigma-54-dependent Fis family transcriptional regulator n=1 Tax=Thermanaerosceptrum fracticalcis TaxID=1712410 RepID=A0A7G6E3A2_THEFR|nr:sigma-54-dependent Fis family transcriptional regulator [Thermanaerosceptrum fracticalcis]QNB46556.1 sigma-54-dependent Fis family transcriptional regulator [Thermanaerosceptrum fracticalcis]
MSPTQIDFEFVVNSISEGVFTVDTEFNITTFNNAAEHITGYKRDTALGRKCYELLKSSHCCGENCLMQKVVNSGEKGYSTDVVIVAKNGEFVPVEISVMPLFDNSGNIIGGLEILSDQRKIQRLRQEFEGRYSFQNIIGKDHKMQEIYEMVEAVAPYRSSVLIVGESGTGKELVAKAIHFLSDRRYKPFIKVNCAALTPTLLESELFGHEKGAFTGAHSTHQGRFELADKGTIFLDEIGEIPVSLQAKLLRVLQEGEFERVGGKKTLKTDVRVIAATNRNLTEEIRKGNFRQDLFYRLNVFPIKLPPLRERKNDIPLLNEYFIRRFNVFFQKAKKGVSREALNFLLQYEFPGNVRELENALEYAFIKGKGDFIMLQDLPLYMIMTANTGDSAFIRLDDLEKHHIKQVLRQCEGNKQKAAQLLGITRKTLYNKMQKYGL